MATPGPLPPPPSAYTPEYCYRHPSEQTGVHCTRCNRPICPDCMISAPVGYQCPECVGRSNRESSRGRGRQAVVVGGPSTGARVTRILIALNLAAFALELVIGGAGSLLDGPNTGKLVQMGASVPFWPAASGGYVGIATGEYWRLFSSMFLHAGIIHIALNMYGLWLLGTILEDEVGSARMLAIYLISGLAGGAFSYATGQPSVGVGASGAIYGLMGAFVAYNYRRREMRFYRGRLQAIMPWVVLNIVLSFQISFIDWRAHVGGLVVGVAALYFAEGLGSRQTRRLVLVSGFAALAVLTVALSLYGTSHWRQLAFGG